MTTIHPTLEDLVRLQFDARGFSFRTTQPVNSLLSGRHASRLRGRGLTFEELRGYRPGDDIRTMDWRATARLRKPHVRVYSEERERPVLLIIDQRSTMFFGSARTTKATAAAELAALAAWKTLDSGDRVGAIIFGDDEVVEIRPHRSRSNVLRICHEVVRLNEALSSDKESGAANTFNDALRRSVNVAKHDHLILLISDCAGSDVQTRKLATHLAAHNDVMVALVYDPLGIRFSAVGQMTASDGHRQVTVPEGNSFADRFEAEFRAMGRQLRERMGALRIPILPICTHEPIVDQVRMALGVRR
jgi:uncharacterized protein (DUF58 family)